MNMIMSCKYDGSFIIIILLFFQYIFSLYKQCHLLLFISGAVLGLYNIYLSVVAIFICYSYLPAEFVWQEAKKGSKIVQFDYCRGYGCVNNVILRRFFCISFESIYIYIYIYMRYRLFVQVYLIIYMSLYSNYYNNNYYF